MDSARQPGAQSTPTNRRRRSAAAARFALNEGTFTSCARDLVPTQAQPFTDEFPQPSAIGARLGKRIWIPFALQLVAMRRRGGEAATYRRDLRPTVPVPGTWRRH